MLVMCVILAACVSGKRVNSNGQNIDVSVILAEPEKYNEALVRLYLCVNVTFHGVTLHACDAKNPQINVEAGEGGGRAYLRLIEFSHEHMGWEPSDLPVVVEGVYRGERVNGEYRHTLYVTEFKEVARERVERVKMEGGIQ